MQGLPLGQARPSELVLPSGAEAGQRPVPEAAGGHQMAEAAHQEPGAAQALPVPAALLEVRAALEPGGQPDQLVPAGRQAALPALLQNWP